MKINPYTIGYASEQQFYHRRNLLEELARPIPNAYCIIANRRTGKTSLLRKLESEIKIKQNQLPVYISLQGLSTSELMGTTFLQTLRRNTKISLNPAFLQNGPVDFADAIALWTEYCKTQEQHSFLLLDEAEELLTLPDDTLGRLRRVLLDDSDNLTVVICASTRLLRKLSNTEPDDDTSPFLTGFSIRYLKPFNAIEAESLIRQTQLKSGPLEVPNEVVQLAIRFCGGHPYLLQRLCYELFNMDFSVISDVDLVLDDLLLNLLKYDYDSLKPKEQLILRCFSFESPLTEGEIIRMTEINQLEFKSGINELSRLGFLKTNEDGYFIENYFYAKHMEILRADTKADRPSTVGQKANIFIAAVDKDIGFKHSLKQVIKSLMPKPELRVTDSDDVEVGVDKQLATKEMVESADFVFIIISTDALASDEIRQQFNLALGRTNSKAETIIPIIARPCVWKENQFGQLQVLPRDGIPISKYTDMDEAWSDIGRELKNLLKPWILP